MPTDHQHWPRSWRPSRQVIESAAATRLDSNLAITAKAEHICRFSLKTQVEGQVGQHATEMQADSDVEGEGDVFHVAIEHGHVADGQRAKPRHCPAHATSMPTVSNIIMQRALPGT